MINAVSLSMTLPISKPLSKLPLKNSSPQPLPTTAANGISKTLTHSSLNKISSGFLIPKIPTLLIILHFICIIGNTNKEFIMQALKATFTLPDYILSELTEFSQELGEKKSHMVAEALSQYFDTLDLKLSLKRSKEIREGAVQTISFESIKEELGL
jgi:predicted DNA-binding protein